jgi:hypothetical protein
MPFLTSRSAIREFHRCPRARYYQYHHLGTGVVPASNSIPLVVGSAIHVGLESLILGEDVEEAVSKTLASYEEMLAGRGFEPDSDKTDTYYVYCEQRALVEALIRVFNYRGLWPFLEEYDVLETEQEVPLQLFDGGLLESKADGLLRQRSTGDLFILSWKTTNSYDRRKEKDNETDDQGLSEWAALQSRFLRENAFGWKGDDCPQIAGVQMVYLKKGTRTEWPADSGVYYQNSSLVRPWMKDEFPAPAFAHSWEWKDEVGGHRLGKGWRKVNIWEVMSIKEWIDLLASGRVQQEAGDYLAGCVIMPPPYVRKPQEIESWVEQVAWQERAISDMLEIIDKERDREFPKYSEETFLNRYFPQHRRSCNYPTACSFKSLCFGPIHPDEAIESGKFIRREPHHAMEKEKFDG